MINKTRYDLEDWLSLHKLNATIVEHILHEISYDYQFAITQKPYLIPSTAEEIWKTTAQAYFKEFDEIKTEIHIVLEKCECVFDAPANEQPFTLNRGRMQCLSYPYATVILQPMLCVLHTNLVTHCKLI